MSADTEKNGVGPSEDSREDSNLTAPLGWEENGRRKKVGGKKTGRKENWEENVILYVVWMKEGKHRGKKAGTCQSDKNTPIVNTFVKKL